MNVDKIALSFAIIGFAIWAITLLFGLFSVGAASIIVFAPILAIAYLFGLVLSQRLKSREDSYYDNIEK